MPDRSLPMTWDDARSLAKEGVRFGAHTRSHPILTRLDDHGVDVAELTVHTPDLDDVFLSLTGN